MLSVEEASGNGAGSASTPRINQTVADGMIESARRRWELSFVEVMALKLLRDEVLASAGELAPHDYAHHTRARPPA